tara:strand:+ start:5015 stop:6085 length:1071 start_codon:yes stop_codon:yes gene_type:complete
MKAYIQNIELINQYIHKRLLDSEVLMFENRIESDEIFKYQYDEHFIFLEGLKRITLKQQIQNAYKSYIIHKWFKITGISILILGILVLGYIIFLNQKTNVEPLKERNFSIIISDSISTKSEESVTSSLDSLTVTRSLTIKKDSDSAIQTSTDNDNKGKDIRVISEISLNKSDLEQVKYKKKKMNTLSKKIKNNKKSVNNTNSFIMNSELSSEIDNSFEYNGKEYRLEYCDIANESYGEISKFEIDFFCCNSKFYYSNPNNKEIVTLLYFSIKSLKTDKLSEGHYKFVNVNGSDSKPFTFNGELKVGRQVLKISKGEFTVTYNDSSIQIIFNLKLDDIHTVSGKYEGNYNLILNKKV